MSVEIRGLREEEYPELLGTIVRVMGAPRTYFAAHYRHDPEGRPEHSRVVRVDGRIVSHIRLYDRWQWVGGVPIHVGCVGDVCTLPEHRGRGYCRALLEDAIAYWEAGEYDLSMIVSGVGVYERCGWVTFPEVRYHAPAADFEGRGEAEGTEPLPLIDPSQRPYTVRRFARGEDLAAVAEVYAAYHAGRSLATVRSSAYWERHFYWAAREREDAFFVAEGDGAIVAYARGQHGGESLVVAEICHRPKHGRAIQALCEALFTFAHRGRYRVVEAVLPDDHPAVAFFGERPMWAAEERSPLLFRLVNLPRLLQRLEPLFARRLKEAGLPAALLTLRVGDQEADLRMTPDGAWVGPGAGPRVDLSPRDFFLPLFGQASVSELGLASRTALSAEAATLLSALFPRGAPIYWRTDIV